MTEQTNVGKPKEPASAPRSGSILRLNLQCKQSIVDLLMDVQTGKVSCRRAATEIQKQIPKKNLTHADRKSVRRLRNVGAPVKQIALAYSIDASTVWRICKSNVPGDPTRE